MILRDHLHLRGEYSSGAGVQAVDLGSSPLTWRIQIIRMLNDHKKRIISTYVENTCLQKRCNRKLWDHLHLRGEYPQPLISREHSSGSSPLTWRIRWKVWEQEKLSRIISTYVENTIRK